MDIYNSFDLDVTFANVINDPILMLIATWMRVMANQVGTIVAVGQNLHQV